MNGNEAVASGILGLFTLNAQQGGHSLLFYLVAIASSLLSGAYIFYIYKRTFIGVVYNRSFGISLVMLTLGSTLIIATIYNNLTLSLGMLGALSIIRFRTAVKEAMDGVLVLWAVAAGVACGFDSRMIMFGLVGSAIIGVVMVIFTSFKDKNILPFLLIIRHDANAATEVAYKMKTLPRFSQMKSRTVTKNGIEVIVELRLPGHDQALADSFMRINGVFNATLVNIQEDYNP